MTITAAREKTEERQEMPAGTDVLLADKDGKVTAGRVTEAINGRVVISLDGPGEMPALGIPGLDAAARLLSVMARLLFDLMLWAGPISLFWVALSPARFLASATATA